MTHDHDSNGTVLAVDLGGTNLRAGLLAKDAAPSEVQPIAAMPAPRDLESFRSVVVDLLAQARRHSEIQGIGVAVPGTATAGRCLWVPNLPWLDGICLADVLDAPTTVANDAHMALLAEVTAGAGAGQRDVVLFAVGTGIGSAIMAAGRIVTGRHGAACSAGWITLDPQDPGHAEHGWLERHAAGPSFDVAATQLGRKDVSDAQALMTMAAAGDVDAQAALVAPARTLATAIAATVSLLDPDCVLLSGGVAASWPALEPHVRDVLARHTPNHLHGVPVMPGRFGPGASLVGAAIAARKGHRWTEVQP